MPLYSLEDILSEHNKTTKSIRGWNVVEPVVYKDDVAQGRINLDSSDFTRLIEQKGVWVKVSRTTYCPNVKSIDGGEHQIDCELCNGSGFLDKYPIRVRAVILSQNNEKSAQLNGYVDDNSVMVTFPIGIELQYFTLVELCDFSDIFMERVAKSKGSVDHLKYKALRVNLVVDSNGKEYDQATDFCINDVGHILWKEGKGPAPEVIYSVHYEAAVQFRAVTAIHVNRFTQITVEAGQAHAKLPEQWMLKKEFLVRRRENDGSIIEQNPIPNYNEETPD